MTGKTKAAFVNMAVFCVAGALALVVKNKTTTETKLQLANCAAKAAGEFAVVKLMETKEGGAEAC